MGDSAAHIASSAANDLILVEPSDFFFRFLLENAKKFPNRVTLDQSLISNEEVRRGRLVHWGGTAFVEASSGAISTPTKKLSEYGSEICMVKIDTDGFDFSIINGSMQWFAANRPAVVFEHEVRSEIDLKNADMAFENLFQAGYRYFAVFDDPGFLILSTDDVEILKHLNRYQYRIWITATAKKSISNFDVAAFHEADQDAFALFLENFAVL